MKSNNKQGFTLAEVLLTLAIVGIVAALTIPSLISSTGKSNYESGFQKAFLTLSQAVNALTKENNGSLAGVFSNHEDAMNKFCTVLNCEKKCLPNEGVGECFPANSFLLHGAEKSPGTFGVNDYRARLSDNMCLRIWAYPTCTAGYREDEINNSGCADIFVDTNCDKGPNKFGVDIFQFFIGKYSVQPRGTTKTSFSDYTLYCSLSSNNTNNGNGCGGKVVQDGGKITYY